MKIVDTKISDVKVIEPKIFEDKRGFFFESFNQQEFKKAIGKDVNFVQDNHSKSSKGVLRGLHYQAPPKAQGKLVRVLVGEVYDVAVDMRKKSPTFGLWVAVTLSAKNNKQLWIPEGFAHGFLTISETSEVLYKTTEYYSPEHECAVLYNDKDLSIDWPNNYKVILSNKDRHALSFNKVRYFK